MDHIRIRSLGLMITSKCNFACNHCMFSCRPRAGKHMSDKLIRHIGRFIRENEIDEVNIYGGEPFLNTDLYEKCFQEWYTGRHMNWYVKSNGSFLFNDKKRKYVFKHLEKYAINNDSDLGFSICISNDEHHDRFRSQGQIHILKNIHSMFEVYDEGDFYLDERIEKHLYLDSRSDKNRMNPSGRALESHCYDPSKKCYCMMTSSSYDTFEELFEDHNISIDVNGNIQMCCSCDGGSAGNIMETRTAEEVAEAVKYFRERFRKKYKISSEAKMIDTCYLCKKFRTRRKVASK